MVQQPGEQPDNVIDGLVTSIAGQVARGELTSKTEVRATLESTLRGIPNIKSQQITALADRVMEEAADLAASVSEQAIAPEVSGIVDHAKQLCSSVLRVWGGNTAEITKVEAYDGSVDDKWTRNFRETGIKANDIVVRTIQANKVLVLKVGEGDEHLRIKSVVPHTGDEIKEKSPGVWMTKDVGYSPEEIQDLHGKQIGRQGEPGGKSERILPSQLDDFDVEVKSNSAKADWGLVGLIRRVRRK